MTMKPIIVLSVAIVSLFGRPEERSNGGIDSTVTDSVAVRFISANALMQRGNDLYNRNEFSKALLIYQRAEERGAEPATAAFNQGNCLFRLKQNLQKDFRLHRWSRMHL